jgi:hypothetical protein
MSDFPIIKNYFMTNMAPPVRRTDAPSSFPTHGRLQTQTQTQ